MFSTQFTQTTEAFETWSKPAKAAFELWVSFWPVAPFFGVEYRFAEPLSKLMPGTVAGAGEAAPSPSPAPVAKPKPIAKAPKAAAPKVVEATPAKPAVVEPIKPAKAEIVAAEPVKAEPVKVEPVKAEPEAPAPKPVAAKPAVAEPAVAEPAAAEPVATMAEAPAEGAAAEKPGNLFNVAPAEVDDLKMIRGIGPSLEKQLNILGVYRFEQIASMSEGNLTWVDQNLTSFKGRCFRDDWVGQARSQLG
ncbi:MAG: hypothetical protein AAF074_02655 [Pseudomonadota bacterium]